VNRTRTTGRMWFLLAMCAAGLGVFYAFYEWEIERVEVPPGKFLVVVHRWGRDLPEDEIVAPDPSYKGVQIDVLSEGRHFLNPLFWGHEVHEIVNVPTGQCLVLTRNYGQRISPDRMMAGDILAGANERGIVAEVLKPGSYRLNPYAYKWSIVPAVEVKVDQVGVRNLKVGKDPRQMPADRRCGPYVVTDGYRGVQEKPVPPGTYYVNPYVETITPVEVRSHRVELTDIRFPSRDGFILKPQVLVEYAVEADRAPEVLVRLTDEGVLHQDDGTVQQQAQNEILQKIILPHIRGYARIEGSNFDARDFILSSATDAEHRPVNSREALQRALQAKVKPRCKEFGIEVRAVTLAELVPPPELAKQISDRQIALVEQQKNRAQVGQFKSAQKMKAAEVSIVQAREKVEAETRLIQANTNSQQLKEVEESKLKNDLLRAEIRLRAAKDQAFAVVTQAQADANVIDKQNEAEVAGIAQAIKGFNDAQQFAQYHLLSRLGPALAEIFASDQSDFAKFFSTYLAPQPTKTSRPTPDNPVSK
jgi:SPFH domain / Band 7 family